MTDPPRCPTMRPTRRHQPPASTAWRTCDERRRQIPDRARRHQKIFCKNVFHIAEWKVFPTGGQARRNKLLVSWGLLVIAALLAGSLLAPLRCAGPCQFRCRATWQPSRYLKRVGRLFQSNSPNFALFPPPAFGTAMPVTIHTFHWGSRSPRKSPPISAES